MWSTIWKMCIRDRAAGVRETGILVSCSDYHIFKKMHLTRAQAMDKYLGIVKAALELSLIHILCWLPVSR